MQLRRSRGISARSEEATTSCEGKQKKSQSRNYKKICKVLDFMSTLGTISLGKVIQQSWMYKVYQQT